MSHPHEKRRREGVGLPPRMVVIPLLVLLALFAAWSAIWYEGSRRAEAQLTEWMANEAQRGRSYDCQKRRIGGYPFRIEVDCLSPSAEILDSDGHLHIAATRLQAVAMVWQLEHVIIGVVGPLRLETGSGEDDLVALEADWSSLRSSLRAPRGRLARIDVVAENARISAERGLFGPGISGTARSERFEFHHRQEPGDDDRDIAMSAAGLVLEDNGMATEAIDISLLTRLIGLPSPMPRETAEFVAAWRDNDGGVEIVDLRAVQGDSVLRAEGRLMPDDRGRPEGTVTVTLAGPDVRTPGAAGAFGGLAPVLAAALRLGGRTVELDGRQGLGGDIDMREGRVRFGPLSIARLPALF